MPHVVRYASVLICMRLMYLCICMRFGITSVCRSVKNSRAREIAIKSLVQSGVRRSSWVTRNPRAYKPWVTLKGPVRFTIPNLCLFPNRYSLVLHPLHKGKRLVKLPLPGSCPIYFCAANARHHSSAVPSGHMLGSPFMRGYEVAASTLFRAAVCLELHFCVGTLQVCRGPCAPRPPSAGHSPRMT
jgi:hypothetical protein